MSPIKFIKIGSQGEHLLDSAKEHSAVLLPDHCLIFTATSVTDKDVSQEACEAACKACTLLGATDWDMPTVEELSLVIDRTRCNPAINTDYFHNIQNDWYWTKTPAAWSSASAWLVLFSYGNVYDLHRYSGGFALAVRRVGQ